jgi:hypothetical protein
MARTNPLDPSLQSGNPVAGVLLVAALLLDSDSVPEFVAEPAKSEWKG